MSLPTLLTQTGAHQYSPGRLASTWRGRTFLYGSGTFLLTLLLASFLLAQLQRANADLHTIDSDSAPSVDAAEQMIFLLQSLDATVADYLSAAGLQDTFKCILPGQVNSSGVFTNHECDARAIPVYIEQLQGELYAVIRNVTYPGEKTAIRRIQTGFTSYLQDVATMQEHYELGKDPGTQQYTYLHLAYLDFNRAEQVLTQSLSSDQPPTYEVDTPDCTLPGTNQVLKAADWIRGSLQTQVRCLAAINNAHLTLAYQDAQSFLEKSRISMILFSLLCLLVLLALLVRTIWISRVFLHYLLLASLLLAGIGSFIGITTLTSLGGDTGTIHQAVITDRVSIDATALNNDYATAANADESRYLIAFNYNDPTAVAYWQQDWTNNTAHIGQVDKSGTTLAILHNHLIDPLTQHTIFEQLQATWTSYMDVDQQIRSALQQSDPQDPNRTLPAQHISLGASDQDFHQFLDATAQLANLSRTDYHDTITSAFTQLAQASWLAPLLLALAGICSLLENLAFARKL